MLKKVRYFFVKELIQTLRDKRMRMILIMPPILQLIIFGHAANLDVRHIRTAIWDLDRSVSSRDLIGRFASSKYFDIVSFPQHPDEVKDLITRGGVALSIAIAADFSRKLKKGDTTVVQIILDGTESNTALIALGYANQILSEFSTQVLVKRLNRAGMIGFEEAGVELQQRIWFNPNLESRVFYVPGVIASIGVFWFEVPLRGNPLVLLLGAVLFLMSSVAIGLFISTICSTQQQAQISTFFFAMPAFTLSGFAFPIENMPEWIQYLTYVNPLRYFLVIIRGVFLKAIGLDILWPQLLALGILGAFMILLSSLRFQKRLK